MISSDITSGELFYRLRTYDKQDLIQNDPQVSSRLRSFLDLNIGSYANSSKNMLTQGEASIEKLQNIRLILHKTFQTKINHINSSILKSIHALCKAILYQIQSELYILIQTLQNNATNFNAVTLQSTLQYINVLKQEIVLANAALHRERLMKNSLKEQAKVCRDIMLFNIHLQLESKNKIEVITLSSSSAQFLRCVKAVHDNLNKSIPGDKGIFLSAQNVVVLNVFKLKNSFLARNLQKAAGKAKGVKMKGLFCSFPVENFYRFAVFGLSEQLLPKVPAANLTGYLSDINLPEMVSTPWLFSDTPLMPLSEELQQVHSLAGAASKCIKRPVDKPLIRFSKYSAISTFSTYSDKQLERGIILALCRVLILRLKSISTTIDDSEILAAIGQGYDAIFSTVTEEYVLLQPQLVLPEFFIHVSLPMDQFAPNSRHNYDSFGHLDIPSHFSLFEDSDQSPSEDSAKRGRLGAQRLAACLPPAVTPEQILLNNAFNDKMNATKGNSPNQLDNFVSSELDEITPKNSPPKGKPQSSPEKRAQEKGNPQRNAKVKQSALFTIESSVDEFRRAKNAAILDLVKRASKASKSPSAR